MTTSLRPFVRYFLWLLTAIIIIIGILLTLLWVKNNAIAHPLPFENNNSNTLIASDTESGTESRKQVLHIIASPTLEKPLETVLEKFTARYSHVTPTIEYIDEAEMTPYIKAHSEVQLVLADAKVINNIKQKNIANDDNSTTSTDDPNQTLSSDAEQQLATFTFAYKKPNGNTQDNSLNNSLNNAQSNSQSNQGIMIQGYAIDEPTRDNRQDSALINFRQFILASSIQKLIESTEISSIESYKNNVADLFNPNGQTSTSLLNTNPDGIDHVAPTQGDVFSDAAQ